MTHDMQFRRLAANSGWLLSGNTIALALSLLQAVLLARILGPNQFGALAIITTLAVTVNRFVDSRMWETAIKFVVHYREQGDAARASAVIRLCYLVDLLTGALAFAALLLLADLCARHLVKDASAAGLIRLFALSVLLKVPVGTSQALLRIGNRFDWIASAGVGVAALRLACVLIAALLGLGLRWILLAYLVAGLAEMAVALVLAARTGRALGLADRPRAKLSVLRGEYRAVLSFAFFTNLTATSRLFTSRAETLLLSYFAVPADVGVYRLARSLVDFAGSIFAPVYGSVYPELSRLVARGEFDRIAALRRKASRFLAVVYLVMAASLTALFPWLIRLGFGTAYAGSVRLAQIMIWSNIWVVLIWAPGLLLALGRAGTLARLNWIDAASFILFLVVLTAWMGTTGTALAVLIRYFVWTGMAWFVVRRADGPREGR